MKHNNVIYTILTIQLCNRNFPFSPLFIEADTDYLCFTDNPSCTSSDWKIILLSNTKSENLLPYLKSYSHSIKIDYNQIIIDSFEKKDFLITVPDLFSLYNPFFSKDSFLSTADCYGNYLYKKNPIYTDGPFNGRTFQLTIGIPVSNQIQTIQRCLRHLNKLRASLNCELLIINTGSTDGTIEVAQEYGARIISFPWCNNMSAARNAGIYYALGEWYLSLDDDEWFESTDSIIDFFISGRQKQYNFSGYIQRNYTRQDGTQYHDHYTCRMARITPTLHFEGRIHDSLIFPENEVIYYHEDFVHHYGFVHDDTKKLLQKTKRNLELLSLDYYEFPNNLRYILQIANEFSSSQQLDYAIAYFYVGLSTAKQFSNTNYEKRLFSSHLLIALYYAQDKKFFSFSNKCLKELSYSPKDLACIHYCSFDLAETLSYNDSFIEEELALYSYNRSLFLSNIQKYGRSSLLELDVCQSEIFENVYSIHKFALQIRKKEFSNALKSLEQLSLDGISSNSVRKFFSALFRSPVSFLVIGFKKITPETTPVFFEELLLSIQTGVLSYAVLPLSKLPQNSPYCHLLALYAHNYSSEKFNYFQKFICSFPKLFDYITDDSCYQFAFKEYLRVYKDYFHFLYHPCLQTEDSLSLLSSFELSLWYMEKAISHTQNSCTNLEKAILLNPSLTRAIHLFQNK